MDEKMLAKMLVGDMWIVCSLCSKINYPVSWRFWLDDFDTLGELLAAVEKHWSDIHGQE